MNHLSIGRKHETMAGTVPGQIGVIPRHCAARVRAGGGQRMQLSAGRFPHRELVFAEPHNTTVAAWDVVDSMDI